MTVHHGLTPRDHKTCIVNDADCVRGRIRRDLCDRHYGRLLRHGTTSHYRRVPTKTINGRPNSHSSADEHLLRQCLRGKEPAEALQPYARDWLVTDLVGQGWTDLEIATLTRMTDYTTARIRSRLGLTPNTTSAARNTG